MSGPAIIPFRPGTSMAVASEQPGELLYSLETVPPTVGPGANGYTAGTPLTWRFKPPAGRWFIPSESYLEVQMSVWGTAASNAANLAINAATTATTAEQSVAPLAPACLFDSLAIEINGRQIESINSNIAQHAAFRWRLSNKADQRASGKTALWGEPDRLNPVPASAHGANDAADTAAAAASGNAAFVTVAAAANAVADSRYAVALALASQQAPVTQTALDRQALFATSRKQTLNLRLPLALFHQNLPVPAADFAIRAQLTSRFERALQSLTTNANTTITNSSTAGAAAVQITITGLDMQVAYSDYGSSGLYNGSLVIPTNPLFVTSYALSTVSSTDSISISGLPPTAVKYGFALQRATANSGTANHACSPTEFHVSRALGRNGVQPAPGATGSINPVFAVTSFQASIGGRTAPNPTAQFRYSADENNYLKWYKRYELASGLVEPEDADQWMARGPIYMWPTLQIKSPDDRSTDMTIRMERDSTAAANALDDGTATTAFAVPTNLLVFAVAERALVLECRNGEVTDAVEVDR